MIKNGAELSGALKSISKLVSLGTVRHSVFLKCSHRHCLLVKIWNTSNFENSAAFNIKILTVIVLKFSAAGRVTILADDDLLHLKKALLVSGREALGDVHVTTRENCGTLLSTLEGKGRTTWPDCSHTFLGVLVIP